MSNAFYRAIGQVVRSQSAVYMAPETLQDVLYERLAPFIAPPTKHSDEAIWAQVCAELQRARTLYPTWPQDIVHATAIASEESGEIVKSVNNLYWGHGDDTLDDIRTEAIQAIAMWIRFLTDGDYTKRGGE